MAEGVTILIPKKWDKVDKMRNAVAFGRKLGRPAGGYMADLAAKRNVILLCDSCVHKFNAREHRYRKEPSIRVSKCDGCRDLTCTSSMFVAEETWDKIHHPDDEIRKGRWGLHNDAHLNKRNFFQPAINAARIVFGR